MKTLITMLVIAHAAVALAAEPKITETDQGITVEYTGTPSDGSSSAPATDQGTANKTSTMDSGTAARVKSLSGQIQQLQAEIATLSKTTGSESADELAARQQQIDEKKLLIQQYADEVRQLTGVSPDLKTLYNPPNTPRSLLRRRVKEMQNMPQPQ
ncbi:hypothetical protein GURASL_26840 [Geotalea uraniireducens]|uniref:DUF4168 domain-containing protein n=1 Tax=Geotalea uraniireducens TaxID=351604 RepID=A0ABM8EMX5_9BACT|nr:hypothetical protein [Geotalea uraniireducens]BDV43761.1 hypothetical protein GURASL_26840 [Geotalea uraniireducens]